MITHNAQTKICISNIFHIKHVPMVRIFIFTVFFLLTTMLVQLAQASELRLTPFYEVLSDMNSMPALQRPFFKQGGDILADNILDSKSRVIGEIDEVVVNNDGSVYSVAAELDRLALRQSVFMRFSQLQMKGISNGYRLGFDREQIEDIYPTLLADIETAAGEDASQFSLSSFQGARLKNESNRVIGDITEVLFDEFGENAQAFYVSAKYRGISGQTFAVPFDQGRFESRGSKTDVILDNKSSDILIQFLRDRAN